MFQNRLFIDLVGSTKLADYRYLVRQTASIGDPARSSSDPNGLACTDAFQGGIDTNPIRHVHDSTASP